MPTVTFVHVTKRFGDVPVIEDFDLQVGDGELLVLLGGSGSGKSTLLRMVAGLETVTTGSIYIGERDVTSLPSRDRDVAMVFQDYALYPHMSVRENLSLGLRLRKLPRDEIARRVAWAAGVLGLEPLLERKPRQLSGGQRQRVAMGRAMVREPLAFLFDEPLSNLDAGLRSQMRIEIGGLQRRLRTTSLYVTHDQAEAMTLGDRIVVLADNRIQQVGRPMDIYHAPVNRFVAGFLGTPPMNFLDGQIQESNGIRHFQGEEFHLELPGRAGGGAGPSRAVTLGVRPEDLTLESSTDDAAAQPAGAVQGRVLLIERLGGSAHAHIEIGSHHLIAAVMDDRLPGPGERVTVRIRTDRVYLFGPDGQALR